MLKSIEYFLGYIWLLLFITGNQIVVEITFGVIFIGILIQVFIFDKDDKSRKIKNKI